MFDHSGFAGQPAETKAVKEWVKVLAAYRTPDITRSSLEVAVTVSVFIGLWALAWWSLSVSPLVAVLLSVINAGFLLRLFTIQHDCGHGSLFANRTVADWLGRVLGVLTLTPYDVWRRTHSIHHSSSGHLGRRGIGDVHTMTLAEYNAAGGFERLVYRLYRNPVVLFGLGPLYLFFLQNRVPLGLMNSTRFWISAMATNVAIVAALAAIYWFGGLAPILYIFLPMTVLAAAAGVWLFYVQHQFEDTHWSDESEWDMHNAALEGSSHYVLPPVLQWMTANIGIHHVHHLYSRIPFYRLPEVLRDHPELAVTNRLSISESLKSARLHLWDEGSRRLLSFAEARTIKG